MIKEVRLSKQARKALHKVPKYIVQKLMLWVDDVEKRGIEKVREIPGYHDEPLLGERKGQRAIRLSRGYRAIYEVRKQVIEFIQVEEVHKHEY
ncbi:MAG: type II toxin-antitoxin system mRNA interferase toxin, RelE/StbE family [Deltaproteobacteria bacterium]|nr:type II toxin-antitoxin system mRNA interferase toxin, RelE/StbE family [Deltaproteobacteria bacterium]